MEARKNKPPALPIRVMPNMIIIERLEIESKLEKSQKSKAPNLKLDKMQVAKMNKEKLESSGNILDVWDCHPLQGIVKAIDDNLSKTTDIVNGDKIAFRIDENVGTLMVFNKKKYIVIYQHDVLFRYLTNEV